MICPCLKVVLVQCLTEAAVEDGQVERHPALVVLPVDDGGGGHLLRQQAHQLQARLVQTETC